MNAMAFVSASTLSAQRTASSNVLTQWAASVEGRLEPITMETLPGRCPGRDSNVARPIIRIAPRVSEANCFRSCGACHGIRSEEHTSELQLLMRISYAVFCLKKK